MDLQLVADGFSFPTGLTFDAEGVTYIAEAGLPFGGAAPGGRIWRLSRDGGRQLLADGLRPPVNGVTAHDGVLYISEGGHPARISRLPLDGDRPLEPVLDHLPGPGNYHTNMVAFGRDGKLGLLEPFEWTPRGGLWVPAALSLDNLGAGVVLAGSALAYAVAALLGATSCTLAELGFWAGELVRSRVPSYAARLASVALLATALLQTAGIG